MRPATNPLQPLDRDDSPKRSPEQTLFFWVLIRALRDWSNSAASNRDDKSAMKAAQRDAEELLRRDPKRLRVLCAAALIDYNRLCATVANGPAHVGKIFCEVDGMVYKNPHSEFIFNATQNLNENP